MPVRFADGFSCKQMRYISSTFELSDHSHGAVRLNRIIRSSRHTKLVLGKFAICLSIASLCSVISEKETFADGDPIVRIDTTKGPIFCRVFRSAVPMTSSNFLEIASTGFYSGKIFHRIENWCIQGGDPNGNGTGAYTDPNTGAPRYINLEINRNLHHTGGTLAMARSNAPNSASCQFYITKCPMYQLDGKYAIFGRVVGGMDAVMAMRRGDVIQNVSIVQSQPQQQGQSGGSGQRQPQRGRNTPQVPYEPPSEIPDSNF
ncbi:peptidylprolyl isomerase [Candidatus Obscuribacterales bacterium]|nr:peptidylprolyl isomerase [Candidatus Obscuribacterales bacterium]